MVQQWFNRLEKLMTGNNFVSFRFVSADFRNELFEKFHFFFVRMGGECPSSELIEKDQSRSIPTIDVLLRPQTVNNSQGFQARDRGALERFHLRGRICENHSHEDQNAGHLSHPDLLSDVMNSVYSEEHQENVNC